MSGKWWALCMAAVLALWMLLYVLDARAYDGWQTTSATAYAAWEDLTGCVSPGRCRTACGGWLDDRAYTVAANPALGLGCGQRIVVCQGRRCRRATVTDRTASRFGFELTYSLSRALGASRAGWDTPRTVRWRRA